MRLKLFLLFTLVPIVELFLLIRIAQATNLWVSLAMVVLPGLLGAYMIKREGLRTWREAMGGLAAGSFPADAILDGLILLVGGVLLITPGVITVTLGLLTLLPPVRALVRGRLKKAFAGKVKIGGMGGPGGGAFRVFTAGGGMPRNAPPDANPPQAESADHASTHDPFADKSPFGKR